MTQRSELFFRLSAGFVVLAVLAAIFAPQEQTLGKILGLIYLHIGFVYAGLLLFIVAAVLSLSGNEKLIRSGKIAFGLALVSWAIYLCLSMVIAYLSWGNINWQEPRLVIGINIFFTGLLIYLLQSLLAAKWSRFLLTAGGVGAVVYWSTRWSMLHPAAPIRNSDSTSIIMLALVCILSIIVSVIFLLLSLVNKEFGER